MSKTFLALILCLGLAVLVPVGFGSEQPADQAASPAVSPDFSGKIVMFVVDKSTSLEAKTNSVVLKDPRIVLLGERSFVHGKTYTTNVTEEWAAGVEQGIACDRVLSYHTFDAESFASYLEYSQERREED